jgi:cytoskeletal protein RodZ
MQNNTTSKAKDFIKKHKKPLIIAGAVYAVFMIGIMALGIGFIFSEDNSHTSTPPTESYSQVGTPAEPTENTPQEPVAETKPRHTVSEDAAEHYCQDAGLLNKYVDSSKISTIYATNYNKKYTDSFVFDKNGNPIWFFQWNGKNKATNEPAGFSCWISGSSDSDITLHWLSLDGTDLYGQAGFEQYKEDGQIRN